jgi:histidyl-tRNA synthetase
MVNLARGTRDFLPDQAAARHAVIARLRTVFSRHGFEPLDTPAFERIETLTGKYGEEGQRLIFQILKRGEGGERGEVDLALRYDLTVHLARVVAMNPGLRMPFKRWQIAPVWRADRPAKGRFREFWQCDCDIVGSTEPLADASCLAVAADAFATLGFRQYTIRLNDRRLLSATARAAGVGADLEIGLFTAIDKLDKIGRDGVDRELAERGIDEAARARLWRILSITGDRDLVGGPHPRDAVVAGLREALAGVEAAGAALDEVVQVASLAEAMGVPSGVILLDPTLARGLDYYTGPIWEFEVEAPKVGSLGSGGRYDGLIGVFGKTAVPAVGTSFGLERIVLVMEEHGMLPARDDAPQVLVAVFDAANPEPAARAAAALRRRGIRADLYTGTAKLRNQLKYADAIGVSWVVIAGPGEAARGAVTLKNLGSGEQVEVPLVDLADRMVSHGITPVEQSPHPS